MIYICMLYSDNFFLKVSPTEIFSISLKVKSIAEWFSVKFYFKILKHKTVQVGKYQEKAHSEKRFPIQKPRLEKTKLAIRYLYRENIS